MRPGVKAEECHNVVAPVMVWLKQHPVVVEATTMLLETLKRRHTCESNRASFALDTARKRVVRMSRNLKILR